MAETVIDSYARRSLRNADGLCVIGIALLIVFLAFVFLGFIVTDANYWLWPAWLLALGYLLCEKGCVAAAHIGVESETREPRPLGRLGRSLLRNWNAIGPTVAVLTMVLVGTSLWLSREGAVLMFSLWAILMNVDRAIVGWFVRRDVRVLGGDG